MRFDEAILWGAAPPALGARAVKVADSMVQDLGIAQILTLLGVSGGAESNAAVPEDASSTAASDEARFDIVSDGQPTSISRTEARLLLFLSAPIREWLAGGDPAGAASNLRWSVVKTKERGGDVMEVRVGDREPMLFDRSVASASLAVAAELRSFAQTRG